MLHMDPKKITATEEELLDDVWEQACGSGKNEVIEKIMFDKWLFSNTYINTNESSLQEKISV